MKVVSTLLFTAILAACTRAEDNPLLQSRVQDHWIAMRDHGVVEVSCEYVIDRPNWVNVRYTTRAGHQGMSGPAIYLQQTSWVFTAILTDKGIKVQVEDLDPSAISLDEAAAKGTECISRGNGLADAHAERERHRLAALESWNSASNEARR